MSDLHWHEVLRDVPSLDGRIELPWDVGRSQDQHAGIVVAHTVHLGK